MTRPPPNSPLFPYPPLSRPQFAPRGFWHYRQLGFPPQRPFRPPLVHLGKPPPAGQTHEELQDVLLLRVHNTLRLLVRARELQRRLFQDVYVYLSAKPKPASRQWAERQKLAPPPAPKELHPARVIDILVDLLHHPEDEARAVCQRLRAGGHPVTPEQIETIWAHYHLKKTPHVRSRHGRP